MAALCLPTAAYALHAAEGMMDEEIYAMIDELVADTPHAAMTLDDLGGRRTQPTITVDGMSSLEEMIADGLLYLVSDLQGDVSLSVSFTGDGGATLTITQTADPLYVRDGSR